MARGPKNSHTDLSAEFVREVFDYNPTTGDLFWKSRLSKRVHVGDVAGTLDDQGRIKIGIQNKEYLAHRIIWLWVTGNWPAFEVDHENCVRSDNRWKNLREAHPIENHRNKPLQKNSTAGYKGVCFDKRAKKFVAGIKYEGKRHHLGHFNTAEEAHAAYCAAAKKRFGAFFRAH